MSMKITLAPFLHQSCRIQQSSCRRVTLCAALLLLALVLLPSVLLAQGGDSEQKPKPLDLENVSKKMSLWPDQVQVIREIRYRAGEEVKSIPRDTTLEVISIQPNGIEVEYEGRRMLVRQEFVDLRARVVERIREIATAVETQERRAAEAAARAASRAPRDPGTQAGVDEDGLPPLEELGNMPEEQRKAFLRQLSPEQQQLLVDKINAARQGQGQGSNQPGTNVAPAGAESAQGPQRPQPRIQSSALTEFVRKLHEDLLIMGNTELREYREIGFRDNEFFLLLVGMRDDSQTKVWIPLLKKFYERSQVYRQNYEIVYIDRSRRHIQGVNFIKSQEMPWPSVNPEKLAEHDELIPLLPRRVSPALILVDRQGQIISSTAPEGGQARNPEEVLKDLASVIDLPSGPGPGM